MDDKKKRHTPHRDGERKEQNGQRISVRPGNFTPPGTPTLPAAQSAQQNGGERRGHHGRNHHNKNHKKSNPQNQAQNAEVKAPKAKKEPKANKKQKSNAKCENQNL